MTMPGRRQSLLPRAIAVTWIARPVSPNDHWVITVRLYIDRYVSATDLGVHARELQLRPKWRRPEEVYVERCRDVSR